MPAKIYFCDLRASMERTLKAKMTDLMKEVGLAARLKPRGLTALKLHFGEIGNTAFIRPVQVRHFVRAVQKAGAQPFLTDCNTLYVGSRSDAVNHLNAAVANGFAYSVVGAPVIIADGLRGRSAQEVRVDLPECSHTHIGREIAQADAMVCLTHFKGHEMTGFGGAIKNLGMGCASRQGKLFQHSDISPLIDTELCVACGTCVQRCPATAIKLVKRGADDPPAPLTSAKPQFMAVKDADKCIGCGDCILACPQGAISVEWDIQIPLFQRRVAAYALGAVKGKEEFCTYFNFITQVSPACDCNPFQDAPVVADIGVLAGQDPVAIDQASVDLVNQAPGLLQSCLKQAHAPGADKFRDVYPDVDWNTQLEYAQEIGLGTREYELVKVD